MSLPGEIVTFYSYKGGTGRSMMLANVAWILADAGKRVLVIDWDLEAPGLHRYFQPFMRDPDLTQSDGVIDLAIEFATEAVNPDGVDGESWYLRFADIRRYAFALDYSFRYSGALHFVPAGRQGASYAARVNSFDWSAFYTRYGGEALLEAIKSNLRDQYDYVLIDSRTGISDTSGICTVQMPDTLVACFTLNNQGIEGASAVVKSVLAQRREPSFRVLPVAMRVENSEKDKVDERKDYARRLFAGLPNDLTSADAEQYWSDTEVVYVPYYAYEETLATFADPPGQRHTVLAAAELVTAHVTRGAVTRAEPPSDRALILEAFGRRAAGETAAATRYDAYVSYPSADNEIAVDLCRDLRRRGMDIWIDLWELKPGSARIPESETAMRASRMLLFLIGEKIGPGQSDELERALALTQSRSEFRVIPVLLPSADTSALPRSLAMRQWLDLREGIADPSALSLLVETISGRGSPSPPRPPSPPHGATTTTRSDRAADMTLYRRTYLIERRLDFVLTTIDWLRELDPRGTATLVHELQNTHWSCRRELDRLTQTLQEADRADVSTWTAQASVDGNSRQLFERCVTLAGGLSIRRDRLDGRLCQISDALLRECSLALTGQPWNGLTVPRSAAGGSLLALPFSDWTLWSLPLIAHSFVRMQQSWRELVDRIDIDQTDPQVSFDVMATRLVGPAYACSAILLHLHRSDNRDARRAQASALALQHMGGNDRLLDVLRVSWSEQPGDSRSEGSVDHAVTQVFDLIPPFGLYGDKDQAIAEQLAETWLSGLGERRPLPKVSPAIGLRHLLNAAWVARISGGEQHAGTLDEQVKALCEAVIEREESVARSAPALKA